MHVLGGRNAAFAGLLLGMLMASLDTNVVVAALPSIAASLGGSESVSGVTAAYLLAVAVASPLHGSLGDRWGRRRMFVGSVIVFAIGSLACAAAPSMVVLIGCRALQGLGGSGLIVAAISAMAELFDRQAMVARQGWLTAMFAVSSVGGAPIGGFLAAGPGWRWIFLLNLPISGLALVLGAQSVPGRGPGSQGRDQRFDIHGAALIALAGSAVVLLGSSHTLARSPIWAPLLTALAGVAAVGFVRVERRASAPLVPPRVFADPGLARSVLATLGTGVALFGSFTFVPLAIASGTGVHPAATGLLLLPLSIGQVAVTSAFAALARRWPSLTSWGRLGLALGVLGLGATAAIPLLDPGAVRTVVIIIGLSLSGAALGLSMQAYTLLGQTRAPTEAVGASMASLTFARQIGGSLGIAIFGWVNLFIAGSVGLSGVFILAALALLASLFVAPNRVHDRDDHPAAEPQRA